jgi:hypothetical protein
MKFDKEEVHKQLKALEGRELIAYWVKITTPLDEEREKLITWYKEELEEDIKDKMLAAARNNTDLIRHEK